MLRILQVLPRLRRGGSQTMVMNLYRAIDRSAVQFDFIIFTSDHDDYYEEIYKLGGKVFHFAKYNGFNRRLIKKEWDSFFNDHPEYKVIHSHVRSFASIYLPIAKKHGLVSIIHSHSTSNGKGFKGFLKSVLEYPLRFQADYLFACSSEAGEWLYGRKATHKNNYFIFPNAIDLRHFTYSEITRNEIRSRLSLDNKFVVGHVGGFETPKNHSFLLSIFAEILKINSNSCLLLVGDGTLEQEIKKKCFQLNISDKVVFAGLQEDVAQFLFAMDVFVFPSLWEGLPVSVVEAQASGLPCFISSTITRDVYLTNLIASKALSESPSIWAEDICKEITCKRDRCDFEKTDEYYLFDVSAASQRLLNFYLSINKNK